MFGLAAALGGQPLPRGRRVAIVTNAGGPAILCTDMCEAGGLLIPELSPALRAQLAAFLPAPASVANPIDMIASAGPQHYRQAIDTVLGSDDVDALIVIYIPVGLMETAALAKAIREGVSAARAWGATSKPVLACMMADQNARQALLADGERIPVYAFPEAAGRVLGKAARYSAWRAQPPGVMPEFDDLDLEEARSVWQEALARRGPGSLSE